ncbi:MAG: EAL domain-containing protein [Betaproteobacteria bacterium]|nr:EAL domain-containing protein [Betaproteobacteria bacterium]
MNAAIRHHALHAISAADERANLENSFHSITRDLPVGDGWANCNRASYSLSSHFQPIFEVASRKAVAYEGLLTAHTGAGQSVNPQTVFDRAHHESQAMELDWLCRGLHLRNFANVERNGQWLFLNAYPEAAIEDPHHPEVFESLLKYYGVAPENVVIEILETGVSDEAKLADAVALYRALGCRIAIDDFGIGYSNFDRLWRLKPDFVKIDRSVNATAVRDAHARRVLVNTINLIHECGARVIVEGIETRDEALLALESGTDFVQGYYFARPGKAAVPEGLCGAMFRSLHTDHLARQAWRLRGGEDEGLAAFSGALALAVEQLREGAGFRQATQRFRDLPTVLRVYLVSSGYGGVADAEHERVVIDLIDARSHETGQWTADATGTPLEGLRGVLSASLAAPSQVHLFSAVEATPARGRPVTLSCAFEFEGRMVVLIGEIVDRRLGARAPAASAMLSASGRYYMQSIPLG